MSRSPDRRSNQTIAPGYTQGDMIRTLFEDSTEPVTIIAPFIKRQALQSLLHVIPSTTVIRCVTRWIPHEIAAGISDPEILDDLEQHGLYRLTLVNKLHAKLYIAGRRCLVGSANVTGSGLGDTDDGNIEILVATTTDNPGVQATLSAVAQSEQPATKDVAEWTRMLADRIQPIEEGNIDLSPWFPRSRRAQDSYRLYSQLPITGKLFLGAAEALLLSDIARTNVMPGLTEDQFRDEICTLLRSIPLAASFLSTTGDFTLTKAEAQAHLTLLTTERDTIDDLWCAFVNWMIHFFPRHATKQEITEVALRRAQRFR